MVADAVALAMRRPRGKVFPKASRHADSDAVMGWPEVDYPR